PRAEGRRPDDFPHAQLRDHRQMSRRDLADEQRFQLAAFAQVTENLEQAAQIDGIFREAAAAVKTHGNCIRRALREFVVTVERAESVDERRTVEHMMSTNHSGSQHTQSRTTQAADEVLGEDGQSLLKAVVAGEADFELLERLMVSVVASDQMRA